MNLAPMTVGELIVKLRKMHGHLSTKDRRIVLDAIGSLEELAERLAKAEGRIVITKVDEEGGS